MQPDISTSAKRADVPDKISGSMKYIGDYSLDGMLHARTLRSARARAKIKSIHYPILPEGYFIVDKNDVPGRNGVKMLIYDQPFFAEEVVNYIGEPIALVVGVDKSEILEILSQITIEYEDLNPILTIDEGLEAIEFVYGENNIFAEYQIGKGKVEAAEKNASFVYEGVYETGYQEQFYMEPQGVIGIYKDDKVSIYGSMQCPYYVKKAVEECLGFSPDRVRIVQAATGGAFGGKEDYPSIIAGQVACAAIKTGRPVKLIFERNEDLEVTTKRHPSRIKLKSYIDSNNKVIGMKAVIDLDAGAYAGLSSVVLQRAMFACAGVYNIEHLEVHGRAVATNKAPSGAFRGFGAPQAFYAIETHMEHIAGKLGVNSLEFKIKNMLKQGDRSSTGGLLRDRVKLPEMIDRVLEVSDFKEKQSQFETEKKVGKLHGIGLSIFFHGGGFTGSGERDHIKAKVKLRKHSDKSVEILVANTEMGQGLQTTLRKIAANALNIPMEKIEYNNPDTDNVPDSGPTVASRSVVIVGKLVEDASRTLKVRWDEEGSDEAVAEFKYPGGFEWDNEKFIGDAYTSYSWGVNAVEVELDPITLESTINGVWAVYDIGKAIDNRIVRGQIDGGILQGLGYAGIEVSENQGGRFLQRTSTDCIIPTSMDAPKIWSELICEPYEGGPLGAKGLGELTLIGSPVAYALAVENALGRNIDKIPIRPENLMEVE